MITVVALKWAPPFAQGQVRDHRVRWVLEEVGWDYRVELIDPTIQQSADYRAEQPFGQVPVMREDGRPTQFETGAIVLDVATRAGALLPSDPGERARVMSWFFAALNSIEPFFAELAVADVFLQDAAVAKGYRAYALPLVERRLGELSAALGGRDWLVGDAFSIADLMGSSVCKLLKHTDLVEGYPNVAAWRDRCFARPGYQKAIADQLAEMKAHGPKDMGWDPSLADG